MQLRTVELRSRARAAGDLLAAAADDADSPGPVFVDSSGRRGRGLRLFGWLVGVVCVGFAAVLVTTLMSARSDAPQLDIPDQQQQSTVPSAPRAPAPSKPAVPSSGAPAAGRPTPVVSALAGTALPPASAAAVRHAPAATVVPVTSPRSSSPAVSRTTPAASPSLSARTVSPSRPAVPTRPSATAPTHRHSPILPFPTSFPT
jgi:cytoskeletal protein RodZ